MYEVWMSGVLVVFASAAAGTVAPTAPPCLVGGDQNNVSFVLGQPNYKELVAHPNGVFTDGWIWRQVDWLGTRRERRIVFNGGKVAETDITECQPFAVTPPWLKFISDAAAWLGKEP